MDTCKYTQIYKHILIELVDIRLMNLITESKEEKGSKQKEIDASLEEPSTIIHLMGQLQM